MSNMKLATKILLAIGTFLAGLLTLPGVNDYIVAFVGATVAAHPKLAILSVIVTFLLGLVHQPAKLQASPLAGSVNYSQKSALAMILCVGLVVMPMSGCSASNYQKAETAYTIIQTVLTTAQAELPLFVSTGSLSQADEAGINNYVSLAITFNGNYNTCIGNAQNTTLTTASKFVDCLGVFATSLNAPATLATLHIVSSRGQSKAQAIVAAIVGGVNIGFAAFKAANVVVPAIATASAETQEEIDSFQAKVIDNLPPRLHTLALANGY